MPDNRILYQPPLLPVNKPGVNPAEKTAASSAAGNVSFAEMLQQQLSGVKFSQHALQRLQSRNIHLGSDDLQKLNQAVAKAAQKGSKESLVLMNGNLAFVVSVKNKTVITALDGAGVKDNVFTNIDSAVIV
jgi:flagellar operon protein